MGARTQYNTEILQYMANPSRTPALSVVVIGKNEGGRLKRSLDSVQRMSPPQGGFELIYVDSYSTDDSVHTAQEAGARVVVLGSGRPTPGSARNAGWCSSLAPFILFLDGDCVVHAEFAVCALPEFGDPKIAAVFGRVREQGRESSVYDRVMELDRCNPRPGAAVYCSGNCIIRRSALEAVNGYDPDLIACEEPDLCVRMRKLGLVILRVEVPMAEHDLGMCRLSQYCVRAFRAGYGFAEVSDRYPGSDIWDEDKAGMNRTWGTALALLLLISAIGLIIWGSWIPFVAPIGFAAILALGIAWKNRWKTRNRVTCLLYGLFWVIKQLPTLSGQSLFQLDKLTGRKRGWISYK
jgi:glycosyltransferase involved in cell wall biosynthesis